MCTILLSINPEFVEQIFNGTKKYEYRKVKCKRKVEKVIIYETSPIMKVVGETKIKNILEGSIEEIWQQTKDMSGTTFKSLSDYYGNCKIAIAYELEEVQKYDVPHDLSEYGIKNAPQSFVYID